MGGRLPTLAVLERIGNAFRHFKSLLSGAATSVICRPLKEAYAVRNLENLKSLLPKITREGVRIYTNQLGAENLLIATAGEKNLLRFWRCTTLKEDAITTLAIAYGENSSGGMLVYDKENEFLVDFGKGKKTGFAFLLQRIEDVCYISIFDDADGESSKFFMTATDDDDAVAIILTLLSRFIEDIKTLKRVQELLMQANATMDNSLEVAGE